VIAVSAGTLILALSSLSRNSRYVALMWLGVWFVSGAVAGILVSVNHFQQAHQIQATSQGQPNVELVTQELEAAKSDWRPLVSYTENLSRIGKGLLGTDACWERIGQLRPDKQRMTLLYSVTRDSLYPWYWSAAVLAVLLGLSACILNFSVKSLDRLK
jgi:hypothetical protein